MAKPENAFIASVHAHLPPPSQLYRMKNHSIYTAGVADSWYSGKGTGSCDLWVEWKFVSVPARDSTPVKLGLSALQTDWLHERYHEGRNVWVVAGSKDGGVIFRELDWEEHVTAGEFRRCLLKRKDIAAQIAQFAQGSL